MAKLAFNSKFSESHFSKNLDVFVGLSGGADSIALLHYLNEMNKSNEIGSLKAIHVNHGYSPESKKWENFCKDFCNNHNIEFTATHYIPQILYCGSFLHRSFMFTTRYSQSNYFSSTNGLFL